MAIGVTMLVPNIPAELNQIIVRGADAVSEARSAKLGNTLLRDINAPSSL